MDRAAWPHSHHYGLLIVAVPIKREQKRRLPAVAQRPGERPCVVGALLTGLDDREGVASIEERIPIENVCGSMQLRRIDRGRNLDSRATGTLK